MSKPKSSNAPVRNSEADGDSHQRPEIIHLDSVPIADPWREKRMFEKGESARKLAPVGAMIALSENDLWKRIMEVNRQCFVSADSTTSRLKVVRDFAKHFPDLVFDAWWIKDLLKREHPEHSFLKAQNEVLRAIQTGLRSAVKSQPRESTAQKFFRISAARLKVEKDIEPELLEWNKSLQRGSAPLREWIAQQAAEKADELIQTYHLQGRDARERLWRFLEQGHCYPAAVLIASELLDVNERDIESKID